MAKIKIVTTPNAGGDAEKTDPLSPAWEGAVQSGTLVGAEDGHFLPKRTCN